MSKENLPIAVDNNKSLATQRKYKKNIRKIKNILLSIGTGIAGFAIIPIGGIAIPIAYIAEFASYWGIMNNTIINPVSSESKFSLVKNPISRKITIGQDPTKILHIQKMKDLNPSEKAANMGLGMLVGINNIQQIFEDKNERKEKAKNGDNNVYQTIFKMTTHGDNVKIIDALETLGYIQVEKKTFKKKSPFILERLGFGEYKTAISAIKAKFNKEEIKKYEHDFFYIEIKITDKELNIDDLVKRYINVEQIDKNKRAERKALKSIGLIFRSLKDRNIDVEINELGETQIAYDSEEPLLKRVQRENSDKCGEYRKITYVGDKLEQTPVQTRGQDEITQENQQNEGEGIEH